MMQRAVAIIIVVCVLLLPLSILDAQWAPRAETLLFVCGLSLASGLLIAPLRWPRAARWLLITLAGLLLAASNAGLIRLGMQAAFARVLAWASELRASRIVQDPDLVTFWVTLLIWWTGYSAAHGVASQKPALNALLPTLIALTVNSIYTQRSSLYIIAELSGLTILMVWTTNIKRQAQWNTRGLDYPDTWPEWIGSGAFIAIAVCGVAWLFPPLTSKSTVEWLKDTFNPTTSEVRKVAQQMLGGATPIPLPSDLTAGPRGNTSLPTSRLIGNPPELAHQVVMWVWTDQPPPLPDEARGHIPEPEVRRPYWRGLTYSTYTGRGWSNGSPITRPLSSTLVANLTQRFDLIADHGDTVFAANQPMSITAGLAGLYVGTDLIGLRGTLSQYTVTSHLIEADEDTLRRTPFTYTLDITPYLQLPATLPERVRDVAGQITQDAATPYDKAVRLEAYLRTYSYTLDLPPVPEGRDVVDYFLFDAPGGYCDYYASAMVVMLRAVGVPARLATGYVTGVYDFQRDEYRVVGANAHSWPEVYFEGVGWVEFEPTASQPVLTREQRAPPISLSGELVRATEVERERRAVLTRDIVLAVSGLALLTGALAAFWIRRERRLLALPADQAIPLLYQRLRRRGKWLGVTIHSSDTPDEFVTAFNRAVEACVATRWQTSAAIAQTCAARIGELYRRASYSTTAPGANEARQAWSAWRALSLRSFWIGWWGKLASLPRRFTQKIVFLRVPGGS